MLTVRYLPNNFIAFPLYYANIGERSKGSVGGMEIFFCFLFREEAALFQYVRQPVKWYLRLFTFARIVHVLRYVITKRMKRNLLK